MRRQALYTLWSQKDEIQGYWWQVSDNIQEAPAWYDYWTKLGEDFDFYMETGSDFYSMIAKCFSQAFRDTWEENMASFPSMVGGDSMEVLMSSLYGGYVWLADQLHHLIHAGWGNGRDEADNGRLYCIYRQWLLNCFPSIN